MTKTHNRAMTLVTFAAEYVGTIAGPSLDSLRELAGKIDDCQAAIARDSHDLGVRLTVFAASESYCLHESTPLHSSRVADILANSAKLSAMWQAFVLLFEVVTDMRLSTAIRLQARANDDAPSSPTVSARGGK